MVYVEENFPEKFVKGELPEKIRPEKIDDKKENISYKIKKSCRDILNKDICVYQEGCQWNDSESSYDIGYCSKPSNPFAMTSFFLLLIPLAYGIMYKFITPKLAKLIWTEAHLNFKYTYIASIIIAFIGLIYVIYNINYSDKYKVVKKDYWPYLLVFIVGATLCPIIIFLALDFNFSKYWVLVCLFTTSIGIVWLLTKYMSLIEKKAYFDMGLTYYLMFHVIFIDNFLWWLAFSTS
tara:strand:- start:1132 stop:1839 length:708 start_codon:yes stop_codon:yes gene_type:complete